MRRASVTTLLLIACGPQVAVSECCVTSICDAEIQLGCVDDFLGVLVDGHAGFG